MARKKKEKKMEKERERMRAEEKKTMGFGAEEKEEALEAEGMIRTDMDVSRVELIDRDQRTPFIETYDEDMGELEGKILLKDGNREGLLLIVNLIEELNVKQDHDAKVESIDSNYRLKVENPSKVDRLWDINITLKNIEAPNLKSDKIEIKELGITEEDKVCSYGFKTIGEAKNLLLIKEFVNTLPNAEDILRDKDIESELLKLKNDEDYFFQASGDLEYSLESYVISLDRENTVTFAIALRNIYERSIKNVKVVKKVPDGFANVNIRDYTIGRAEYDGDSIIWTIELLNPEKTAILKFNCNIIVSSIESKEIGTIHAFYQASNSFTEDVNIDTFDAYTNNRFYIDAIERDDEPGIWDCKLIFDNSSEFIIELFNADVYAPEDQSKKYVDIDPKDIPRLPAGAQWHSHRWEYESEEYPVFSTLAEFRVMPSFQTMINGTIIISDMESPSVIIKGEATKGEPIKEEAIREEYIIDFKRRLYYIDVLIQENNFPQAQEELNKLLEDNYKQKLGKFDEIANQAKEKLAICDRLNKKNINLEKKLSDISQIIKKKDFSLAESELNLVIDEAQKNKLKKVLSNSQNLMSLCKEGIKLNLEENKLKEKLQTIESIIQEKLYNKAKIEIKEIIDIAQKYNFQEIINSSQEQLNLCNRLEVTEKIKLILEYEYKNQEKISKTDIVRELKFTTDEAEYYFNFLEVPINYDESEIANLKARAEIVLMNIKIPTLFDVIDKLGFDIYTARKVGKYLIEKGWIKEFPNVLKKQIISSEEQTIQEAGTRITIDSQKNYKAQSFKVEVFRGGDWKIEGDQSIFYYKVKVKNISDLVIPNIQIFLTSIPKGLEALSDKYKIDYLRSNSHESPTFKLRAKESCVGDIIQALISYTDPSTGEDLSVRAEPFKIKYVCNLLIPKNVSKTEFDRKTIKMEDQKLVIDCDKPIKEIKSLLIDVLQKNNFYILPQTSDFQKLGYVKIEGYAQGKYDKQDVALSIIVEELEEKKQLIIKSMSDEVAKLVDILREISAQCDDIKSDTEFIKEYIPLIEGIFDKLGKLDEIEVYLKEHLASDWEKIKESWKAYKEGKIKRKDLIGEIFKIGGKRVIKKLIEKYI